MDPLTYATIDRGAFANNLQILKDRLAPATPIIAVVKADGYGYGLIEMARAAVQGGAWGLGVGSASDAVVLRDQGIEIPTLLLYPCGVDQIQTLLEQQIALTVSSVDQLRAIAEAAQTAGIKAIIHLQLETGMHHFGLEADQLTELATICKQHESVLTLQGVSTHFAAAANDTALSTAQAQQFVESLRVLHGLGLAPEMIHVASSAVVDTMPELCTMAYFADSMPGATVGVRCGSLLYGTYKAVGTSTLITQPVLTAITSHIVDVKNVTSGETIGYFNAFQAKQDCRIALLPIGWSLGFFPVEPRAYVLIRGAKAQVVGPIGANVCAVDITDISGVTAGDEVMIVGMQAGETITLEDVAQQAGTFVSRQATLFAGISKRYLN